MPWSGDDHRLVAHRRDVRAAGRAGAEHGRDLRDAPGRHRGLVVEDPPEVLTVREHLVLPGQERPTRIDQVDAGQAVVQRHLLRAQMLFHRDRVIGAALDRRVVGHDHAFPAAHPPHPGDDARGRGLIPIHAVRRQRRQLQQRRPRIQQVVDPVPGQQLAARGVPFPGASGPAAAGGGQPLPQLRHQRGVLLRVPLERLAGRIRPGVQDRCLHPHYPTSIPWSVITSSTRPKYASSLTWPCTPGPGWNRKCAGSCSSPDSHGRGTAAGRSTFRRLSRR